MSQKRTGRGFAERFREPKDKEKKQEIQNEIRSALTKVDRARSEFRETMLVDHDKLNESYNL